MSYLGTEEDFVMRVELSSFDLYNRYDVMGLEAELSFIKDPEDSPYLSPADRKKAIKKYEEVIAYIKGRLA
jgi:hypothetical protein